MPLDRRPQRRDRRCCPPRSGNCGSSGCAPIRLIGEPANSSRNAASSSASRSASARRGQLRRAAGRPGWPARLLGEAVPRADRQAIVAAVDAVADRLAKLVRDRPGMLDRQVGDAAARIDPVGRRRSPASGRRRCSACSCRNAASARRVRLQLERGVDDAEEQPAAMLAAEQIGVLALPADPGGGATAAFPSPARCRRTP